MLQKEHPTPPERHLTPAGGPLALPQHDYRPREASPPYRLQAAPDPSRRPQAIPVSDATVAMMGVVIAGRADTWLIGIAISTRSVIAF